MLLDSIKKLKDHNRRYIKDNRYQNNITLDKLEQELSRINEARGIRSAIGVFGPSQCGKSYLVSEFIGKNTLLIPGINEKDFQDYNQQDESREATAVVTRFTNQENDAPDRCVEAKLMDISDMMYSFVYGFYNEAKHRDYTDIEANTVREIEAILISENNTENSIPKINHIISTYSALLAHIKDLYGDPCEIGYEVYRTIKDNKIENLSNKSLLSICGVLWKGDPTISAAFESQINILDSLNFMDSVYINENILEDILKASTLKTMPTSLIGNLPECGDDNIVNIGDQVSYLQTVIKEIVFKVDVEASKKIVEKLDILDFPGARSLSGGIGTDVNQSTLSENVLNNESELLVTVFKRGKLFHLFELYRLNYDITILLFCCKNGPQEVGILGSILKRWMEGNITQEIEKTEPSLFVGLTQSDQLLDFENKSSIPGLINGRFKDNFQEPYGDWVNDWLGSKAPFRNFFMVRNPQAPSQGCVDGGPDDFRWRDGFENKKDNFIEQFLDNDIIDKYIGREKELKIKSVFDAPDSSGIPLLIDSILNKNNLDPNKKSTLLDDRERAVKDRIFNYIKENYSNPDEAVAQNEERELAIKFVESLTKIDKSVELLLSRIISKCPTGNDLISILDGIKRGYAEDHDLITIPTSLIEGVPDLIKSWFERCLEASIHDEIGMDAGDVETYLKRVSAYLISPVVLDEFLTDLDTYFPYDNDGASHAYALINFIKWYCGARLTYLDVEIEAPANGASIDMPERVDFRDKVLEIWTEKLPEVYVENFTMQPPVEGDGILAEVYNEFNN